MKKILLILSIVFAFFGAISQTASNFNCNDCTNANHNLFDELDAGNVVILCWVMPCGSCVGPTLTTYNVVQSFATSNPGRVRMYIVDDYANTSCTSLTSWCNSNGFANTTKFSNAAIKMTDYGTAGMPKIVVVGNTSHHVYYNSNNTVNATALSNAITAALQDFGVGLGEPNNLKAISTYPNPSNNELNLSILLEKSSTVLVTVIDNTTKQVLQPQSHFLSSGEQTFSINTSSLKNGIYFVRLQTEDGITTHKFVVSH